MGCSSALGGRGPRRAAPGGLNRALRRLGTGTALASQRTQLEMARRAVNQQQREARPRSWLESRGLSSGTGVRPAQPAGACRAGRMGTQDGRAAGSLAGRRAERRRAFVTVASACLGDQSAFSVARVDSSVPPPSVSVPDKVIYVSFRLAFYH